MSKTAQASESTDPATTDALVEEAPSAIEEAEAQLAKEAEEQSKKMPQREQMTAEQAQAKVKEARISQARTLVALDYLEDLGDCRVGVTMPGIGGRNHIVCIDPGARHFDALNLMGSEAPEETAASLVAIARGVYNWDLKAVRDVEELGVAEGGLLPKPSSLIKEHAAAWKAWKKTESARMRTALRERTKDETFVADAAEDPPETKLELLLLEELGSTALERIAMGIMYAGLQPVAILDGGDQGNS